jgi:hypothetical protein
MDQLTEREQEVAALFVDDPQDAQISGKVERAAFQAGLCLGGIGGTMVGAIIAVVACGLKETLPSDRRCASCCGTRRATVAVRRC